MVTPGRRISLVVDLLYGEVGHEAVRRRSVPVAFARLEENAIAGADDLNRPATPSVT
jgi:hypothetical protein